MKFVFILLVVCIVGLSGQNSHWNSQPEWGPGGGEWEIQPEYHPAPKPERQCINLPNVYNVEFTPVVDIEIGFDSLFVCDAKSRIKQIFFTGNGPFKYACNAYLVDKLKESPWYSIAFGPGKKNTENIIVKNFTAIYSFNNGNVDSQECGTIASGKCAGDNIFGVAIYQANEQDGCTKHGVTGTTAIFREIEIRGKCASKCTLGKSTWAFPEPVNNWGWLNRKNVVNEKQNRRFKY